jgi:hypothetical protein
MRPWGDCPRRPALRRRLDVLRSRLLNNKFTGTIGSWIGSISKLTVL